MQLKSCKHSIGDDRYSQGRGRDAAHMVGATDTSGRAYQGARMQRVQQGVTKST